MHAFLCRNLGNGHLDLQAEESDPNGDGIPSPWDSSSLKLATAMLFPFPHLSQQTETTGWKEQSSSLPLTEESPFPFQQVLVFPARSHFLPSLVSKLPPGSLYFHFPVHFVLLKPFFGTRFTLNTGRAPEAQRSLFSTTFRWRITDLDHPNRSWVSALPECKWFGGEEGEFCLFWEKNWAVLSVGELPTASWAPGDEHGSPCVPWQGDSSSDFIPDRTSGTAGTPKESGIKKRISPPSHLTFALKLGFNDWSHWWRVSSWYSQHPKPGGHSLDGHRCLHDLHELLPSFFS